MPILGDNLDVRPPWVRGTPDDLDLRRTTVQLESDPQGQPQARGWHPSCSHPAMMCRHCLYDIVLSSTDRWRLAWSPDNDAAPYECTEHEAGHEPAGDPFACRKVWLAPGIE